MLSTNLSQVIDRIAEGDSIILQESFFDRESGDTFISVVIDDS